MSKDLTKVVAGMFRFAYVYINEPRSFRGNPPRYSVRVIISKDDKENLDMINDAIKNAENNGASRYEQFLGEINSPLHDGDELNDEVYKNSYYINASSSIRPGLVDRNNNIIHDRNLFYSGVYGGISMVFYPYKVRVNDDFESSEKYICGVGCELNNLQKLEDGERLSARKSAKEDFA